MGFVNAQIFYFIHKTRVKYSCIAWYLLGGDDFLGIIILKIVLIDTENTGTEDVSTESATIEGICVRDVYTRGTHSGVACTGAASIGAPYVGDSSVKSAFVKGTCYVRDACIKIASSFGAVKYSKIHLLSF